MNFKYISLLITNILLCQALPQTVKRDSLQGQGDVTYYGEGGSDPAPTGPEGGSPGACGVAPRNGKYFAALNHIQYGEYANPNNSVVCRRCVRIEHESKSVVVEIVDKCPVCSSGDIDISPTAFVDLFGSLDVGRVHNVNWYETSCDELGKSGSSSSSQSSSYQNDIVTNGKWNEKNINNNNWGQQISNVDNSAPKIETTTKASKSVEVVTSTVYTTSTTYTTSTAYTTKTSYETATTTVTVTANSAPTSSAEYAAEPNAQIQNNYEVLIGNSSTDSKDQTCTCIVSICNPNIPVKYSV